MKSAIIGQALKLKEKALGTFDILKNHKAYAEDKENVDPKNIPGVSQQSKKISKRSLKSSSGSKRKPLLNITNIITEEKIICLEEKSKLVIETPIIKEVHQEDKNCTLNKTDGQNLKESAKDIEIATVKKPVNYITMKYYNTKSRKLHEFLCFRDKDLLIPEKYTNKLIAHSCDNDVTTDDDQISAAIQNLNRSLKDVIKDHGVENK